VEFVPRCVEIVVKETSFAEVVDAINRGGPNRDGSATERIFVTPWKKPPQSEQGERGEDAISGRRPESSSGSSIIKEPIKNRS